jgi:hypothetical protein
MLAISGSARLPAAFLKQNPPTPGISKWNIRKSSGEFDAHRPIPLTEGGHQLRQDQNVSSIT